jgi:glycosyltransferase involved in cell wall biosynthesis
MTRLKIAYLCDQSPLNPNTYSGGNARIYQSLQDHAGDVTLLSTRWGAAQPVLDLIRKMPDHTSLRLRWRMHYALAPMIAAQVHWALRETHYDVLFGAYSLHSLSAIKTPYPMVTAFTSDAVQTLYRRSEIGAGHAQSRLISRMAEGWFKQREGRILRDTDLLLWPSDWVAQGTRDLYGLGDKGHVVPWGANMPPLPKPAVKTLCQPLRLLVLGRAWFAKGGPVAFATLQALRAQGVDARLTVIGCTPPDMHLNTHVTVHPHLDKSDPDQLATLNDALAQAHFMIQPSYESYGFAFCEASAHGLPVLCLKVGGVPVRDGVNGHALPIHSSAADYTALIQGYLSDPTRYQQLSQSARHEYETRLNWDSWGRSVGQILRDAVKTGSTAG